MYKVKISKSEYSVLPQDGGFSVDGSVVTPDIIEIRKGKFHILNNNRSYTAEVVSFDKESKTFTIRVNSNQYVVDVKDRFDDLLTKLGIDAGAGKKVNDIKAPMPGMVLNVMVENGQEIKKGDALVVLEAMKMENILKSPADGIVRKILVIKGDKVEKNQIMVNLD
jgi:biotin carboxyl carrier protein